MRITEGRTFIAQRELKKVSNETTDSIKALSTGDRIHSSAVDPSGLAISTKMKATNRSMQQAARNANQSVSLLQIAEGALNTVQGLGARMRELAMQSANDTVGSSERAILDAEYQQLKNEVNRIAQSTSYGGRSLFDGSHNDGFFESHIGAHNTKNVDNVKLDINQLAFDLKSLGMASSGLSSKGSAQAALNQTDRFIQGISERRSRIGSMQNRLEKAASGIGTMTENLAEARSRIRDTDVASETAKKASLDIRGSTATSMLNEANLSKYGIVKILS